MIDKLKNQYQKPSKKLETYRKNPIREYFYHKTKDLTIKLLELQSSESVLDVGCGNAFLINKIKLNYPKIEIVGIDIIKDQMVSTVKKGKDFSLVLGDAMKLPFADNSFDRVTCTAVLQYLPNPLSAIQETYRIVKDRGIVVFDVPGGFHLQNYLKHFLTVTFKVVPFHKNYLTSKIKQWITDSGFRIDKTHSTRFLGSIFCPFLPTLYLPGLGSFYWCSEQFTKRLIKIDTFIEHIFGQNDFFKLFGGSVLFKCIKIPHPKVK